MSGSKRGACGQAGASSCFVCAVSWHRLLRPQESWYRMGGSAMKPLVALASICAAVWAFLYLAFPTYTHRYRLTIEIDTPQGVRSASGVMQSSRIDRGYLPLPGYRYNISFEGEAIFVDLGDGKSVITTLGFGAKGDDVDQIKVLALKAWGLQLSTPGWKTIRSRQGKAPLTTALIPTMVTFDDLSNPRSAKIVYATAVIETSDGRSAPVRTPQVVVDRLDEIFGAQTSFRGAYLEVTDDPVTRGIDNKLRWLPHPGYLSGQFGCSPSEPHCLHGGHFKR
jgi:hypothetical protein